MKNLKNITLMALLVITAFPVSSLIKKHRTVAKKAQTAVEKHAKEEVSPIDQRIVSVLEAEATRLDVKTRHEVALTVNEMAKTYGLDPILILAVMKVESTFNPRAISNAQAYGLMQVRSIVVKDVANELGIHPSESGKLLSSHTFNIRVGVHYLAKLLKKFGGDTKKALMAYNAGPTTVAKLYKGRSVPEGGYQGKVLRTYRDLSSS